MVTECQLRLISGGGAGKWPLGKDSAVFSATSSNLAAEELGLLLEGQKYNGNRSATGPSRSGSAPPSMEGSRATFDFLKRQQPSKGDGSLETLAYATKSFTNEEQLRGHPAYLTYYCANVNLNPRLPLPLISRENQVLVNRVNGHGDQWEISSFDDSSKEPFSISRSPLSTHKEEPRDDKSSRVQSIEVDKSFISQPMHKSLLDSIQEDYPSSSFPVYDDYSRPSSHIAAKDVQTVGTKSVVDVAAVSAPLSTYSDKMQGVRSNLDVELGSRNVHSNNFHQIARTGSDLNVGTEMKNLRLSNIGYINQHGRHLPHQVVGNPWSSLSQAQMGQFQLIPQRVHNPQNSIELFSHGQAKLSSVDVSVLQSSTIGPPFYTAANTFAIPYYSSVQPANLFPPQFGITGYALNTSIVPPVLTGYPPLPVPIENPVNPSFAARPLGISTTGNFVPEIDFQQFCKIYGQLGLQVQPSFSDQLYMPCFQHPSVDIYSTGVQYDSITTRGNIIGNPSINYDLQKGSMPSACLPDQRPLIPSTGSGSTLSSRKPDPVSANYQGNAPNLGVFMQYPNFPITSQSPAPSTCFSGRINDNMRYSPGSGRSVRPGWQDPGGHKRVEDSKSNSFLEELRSNKSRRYDLSDISGHIVEFSSDQHGSRFIQKKLESCSAEEKSLIFKEVLPHAPALMIDVYGNYVIQKFFEHGSPEQRKEFANKLVGNMLTLSLQMYGCRVIQKALEVTEIDQKAKLVQELDGHVLRCIRDQNGNHVIQKCIECVPAEKIGFIISSFRGQVATLSMHPYGCRVIQRVLEHCTEQESQSQFIVDEILQSACLLAQDQYGNYVTQHVLERGRSHERSQIINKLAGHIVQMSQHKFASNVIEKCLVYGDASEKEHLIEEIVGQIEGNDSLLMMMKDQFANYVVQKILDTCSDKQREILLGRIKDHLHALKKYTYGKHIVARVEQLCGEDGHSSES